MTRRPGWLLALVVSGACTAQPASVFVPGERFTETLEIRTSQGDTARVSVAEGLVLHARRRSGPWVRVRGDSVPEGGCWLRSEPSAVEDEVAGSVRWSVEPEGSAEFNLELRTDGTREVRFSAPGVYRVTAESGGWCNERFRVGPLVVVVAGGG